MTEVGHNNPPIKDQLEMKHASLFARMAELEAAAAKVPEKIRSDGEAGDLEDFIRMVRVALKTAKLTKDAETEPHKEVVKQINATFVIPIERLDAVMVNLRNRLSVYLEDKKAREKAKREEEARRQREEAERAQREAREAEERRIAAERERQENERRAREAEERERRAKQEAKEAEARAKRAQEEAERIEALNAANRAKAEADRATIEKVMAQSEAREAKREVQEASKDQTLAAGEAARAERRADRIEDSMKDDAALSRTRGELGAVGSLAKRWTYRITDYDAIDIEVLRPFINRDAVEAAIYRFMMTGQRDLAGVVFEEISEARVA